MLLCYDGQSPALFSERCRVLLVLCIIFARTKVPKFGQLGRGVIAVHGQALIVALI